ncbi:MAG: hypothetical protein Fur0028_12940 [Bacteroidales bacterium]
MKNRIDKKELWEEYCTGKQTYAQLGNRYQCSAKTIQRYLDSVKLDRTTTFNSIANVLMDTTYFGRGFGVMVFKDSLSGEFLYKCYVKYETNALYIKGLETIGSRGIKIQSIVCDGRKGLLTLYDDIPTQMCQFHQIQIVLRYLTRKPKQQASIELRKIALTLTQSSKKEFEQRLERWYAKWENYLNERSISLNQRKSFYTHKKLRSAYLSLIRNMPYLFVFEQYPELNIPNTTNALDGKFSDLKNKLRNHNGLTLARKKKFIDGFFKA